MARPVDPTSYTPRYIQVAEDIRKRIHLGEYEPGQQLPSTADLAHTYHVSVATIRLALKTLGAEHLVQTEQGIRAVVIEMGERTVERIQPGDRIQFRRSTADEWRRLKIAEGTHVAVVISPDGRERIFPAHAVEFLVSEDEG